MSIGSVLKTVLGFIAGILIPGQDEKITNLTHSIQQELADIYGSAAAKMAAELKVDTTGMTGRDKLFAIGEAIVETALRDGFKGDTTVLKAVALDVAQSAYRAAEPHIAEGIIALAGYLHANPLVQEAVELVAPQIQKAIDDKFPPATT